MPILQPTFFEPPVYSLRNGHLQTIIPGIFRKIEVNYKRERIEIPDGDFLDIDWAIQNNVPNSKKLAIVLHGMEGDSSRHYVTGMVKSLQTLGYDGLAMNFRSCSGEMNRLLRYYHHGDSPDLDFVVRHVAKNYPQYTEVVLIGFSMGGSVIVKYFGESGKYLPEIVKKGLVFSVPFEVSSCSDALTWIYTKNFLISLKKRLAAKAHIFAEIDLTNYEDIKTMRQFDNRYTAPLHNYKDAEDYYQKVSSIHVVGGISRPILVINALDDPFLTPLCYPTKIAEQHEYLYLETPKFGGHVGFEIRNDTISYAEKRALEWFANS